VNDPEMNGPLRALLKLFLVDFVLVDCWQMRGGPSVPRTIRLVFPRINKNVLALSGDFKSHSVS
jgi:hypothetical protein